MKLKEILGLNKKKITIFLIILAIGFSLSIYSFMIVECYPPPCKNAIIELISYIVNLPAYLVLNFLVISFPKAPGENISPYVGIFMLAYFLAAIIWYFILASAIHWLYARWKKK